MGGALARRVVVLKLVSIFCWTLLGFFGWLDSLLAYALGWLFPWILGRQKKTFSKSGPKNIFPNSGPTNTFFSERFSTVRFSAVPVLNGSIVKRFGPVPVQNGSVPAVPVRFGAFLKSIKNEKVGFVW